MAWLSRGSQVSCLSGFVLQGSPTPHGAHLSDMISHVPRGWCKLAPDEPESPIWVGSALRVGVYAELFSVTRRNRSFSSQLKCPHRTDPTPIRSRFRGREDTPVESNAELQIMKGTRPGLLRATIRSNRYVGDLNIWIFTGFH